MKKWVGVFALIIVGVIIISMSAPTDAYDTGNAGGYIFGGCLVLFGVLIGAKAIFSKGKTKDNMRVTKNADMEKLIQDKLEQDQLVASIKKQKQKFAGNSLDLDEAVKILKANLAYVATIQEDPDKVRASREKLDEDLLLSPKVRQFIGDLNGDYDTFLSKIKTYKCLNEDQVRLKKFSESDLKKAIQFNRVFKDDDLILEFCFNTESNKYCLYTNKENKREKNFEHPEDIRIPQLAYAVYIIENNTRLVFNTELYDGANVYEHVGAVYSFDHYELEAFKPGQWVIDLLDIMYQVRSEDTQKRQEDLKKSKAAAVEKNRKNFLD